MTIAAVQEAVAGAVDVSAPAQERPPVLPLGQRDRVYYVLLPWGELVGVKARELGRDEEVESLFGGDLRWLCFNFPNENETGYKRRSFSRWLMRECTKKGLFDPAMQVRGPGVWSRPGGGLVVHLGDKLLIDGVMSPPGLNEGKTLYTAYPSVTPPAPTPAAKDVGDKILELLKEWNFEDELGPELLLGFIGAGLLGGAPGWRVHMVVSAERGAGKSWLARLVASTVGGMGLEVNDSTEAGLRQALTGQARVMILDEAEDDPQTGRLQKVIELIRRMSGGSGAVALRGSTGGKSQLFSVTGCAYMTGILTPVLKPQDQSRIVSLHLKPLSRGDGEAALRVEKAIAEISKESPALLARAIDGWERFQSSLASYRSGFIEAGFDGRDSDRIAALLAGRDLLLHDDLACSDSVQEDVDRFKDFLKSMETGEYDGEGYECWAHLLSSPIDLWRNGERETIGELLARALMERNPAAKRENRRNLQRIGLLIPSTDESYIHVSNRHTELLRIFHGTRWEKGNWRQALRCIPGGHVAPRSFRFGAMVDRAVSVPARWVNVSERE